MTRLLLIIFTIWSVAVAAQKIHFTDAGNQWVVYSTNNGPPTIHHLQYYSFSGDTVIGVSLYKIMYTDWPYSPFPSCSTGTCAVFIREDSNLNKVFILQNDTERILMDYNLMVGDSITHTDGNHIVYIDTVLGIDSTLINSVYHKVWYFSQTYHTPSSLAAPYAEYSVIEGIGCLYKPLFLSIPLWGLDEFNLVCFYNNGTKPVVSPSVPEGYNLVYFDNQVTCTLPVNSMITTKQVSEIYPNPATTQITLTSPNNITNLTITNILGQTICTQNHNSEKVEIDVSTFPSGIYLVKINGTEVKKFIKQ